MGLAGMECDLKERAESIKETVEGRPLKSLIYPSAVITVKKVLKEWYYKFTSFCCLFFGVLSGVSALCMQDLWEMQMIYILD